MSPVLPPEGTDASPGALRTVWPNLPVLLLGSVPVAAAWAVLRVLPGNHGWLAVAGIGLVVLPALAALVRGCEILLGEEHFGLADVAPTLLRGWPTALRVTVVPTTAALLTVLALDVWRMTQQAWVLASIGVGLALTAVAALVGIVALPYSLRTGEPPRQVWLVSCYVTSHNLVPVLGVASALGLGVWGASHLSFALVLLLPAPLALIWATAVASATRHSQDLLDSRVS